MTDPHQQNQKDKEREHGQHQAQREKDLNRGMKTPEQKPPVQPGELGTVEIPEPRDAPWVGKAEGALHPDVVKKEANLALHALRPQPRPNEIEIVLDVMFNEARGVDKDKRKEYTEVDAIREAAVAKFKELFPLTNSAQEGAPTAASGQVVT